MPCERTWFPFLLLACSPPANYNYSMAPMQLWLVGNTKAQSMDCFTGVKWVYGVKGFNEFSWLPVLRKKLTLAFSLYTLAPPQVWEGVVFSCCHQLLVSIQLVFHQAGFTDKEVGPLSLKKKHAALVLRSLSFLHSQHLQPFQSYSRCTCFFSAARILRVSAGISFLSV